MIATKNEILWTLNFLKARVCERSIQLINLGKENKECSIVNSSIHEQIHTNFNNVVLYNSLIEKISGKPKQLFYIKGE